MNTNKTLLNCAIATAMGGAVTAQAETVVSWDLLDAVGGGNSATLTLAPDGLISGQRFSLPPSGDPADISNSTFGATGETGCTPDPCGPIVLDGSAIGTNVFTTGFNWGGTGIFSPNFTAGGLSASITGTTLTFSAMNFGAISGGGQRYESPNVLSNCTGSAGCGTTDTAGYEAYIISTGTAGEYGVRVRFVSTVSNPTSPLNGFQSNWRLEGVMRTDAYSAVPIPAAAYLMGSGLVGLAGVARRRKKKS